MPKLQDQASRVQSTPSVASMYDLETQPLARLGLVDDNEEEEGVVQEEEKENLLGGISQSPRQHHNQEAPDNEEHDSNATDIDDNDDAALNLAPSGAGVGAGMGAGAGGHLQLSPPRFVSAFTHLSSSSVTASGATGDATIFDGDDEDDEEDGPPRSNAQRPVSSGEVGGGRGGDAVHSDEVDGDSAAADSEGSQDLLASPQQYQQQQQQQQTAGNDQEEEHEEADSPAELQLEVEGVAVSGVRLNFAVCAMDVADSPFLGSPPLGSLPLGSGAVLSGNSPLPLLPLPSSPSQQSVSVSQRPLEQEADTGDVAGVPAMEAVPRDGDAVEGGGRDAEIHAITESAVSSEIVFESGSRKRTLDEREDEEDGLLESQQVRGKRPRGDSQERRVDVTTLSASTETAGGGRRGGGGRGQQPTAPGVVGEASTAVQAAEEQPSQASSIAPIDADVNEVAGVPPKRGRRVVAPVSAVAAAAKSSSKKAAAPLELASPISSNLKRTDKSIVNAEFNAADSTADDDDGGNDVRIIFTGIEPEPALVRRIHGTVTERPEQATHMVIGDELKRTPKLMVAINAGVRHIVTLDWLAKSAAKGRPLPITKASRFTVRDPVKEKLWGFDLARTLAVPRGPDRRGVFHGLRVLVTPGVLGVKVPKEDEMAAIVTSGGGRFLPPSLAAPAPEEGEEGSGIIVVSSADIAPTLPAALVNAASRGPGRGVYSADFVFLATLRQEVRFDEDIILRSDEVDADGGEVEGGDDAPPRSNDQRPESSGEVGGGSDMNGLHSDVEDGDSAAADSEGSQDLLVSPLQDQQQQQAGKDQEEEHEEADSPAELHLEVEGVAVSGVRLNFAVCAMDVADSPFLGSPPLGSGGAVLSGNSPLPPQPLSSSQQYVSVSQQSLELGREQAADTGDVEGVPRDGDAEEGGERDVEIHAITESAVSSEIVFESGSRKRTLDEREDEEEVEEVVDVCGAGEGELRSQRRGKRARGEGQERPVASTETAGGGRRGGGGRRQQPTAPVVVEEASTAVQAAEEQASQASSVAPSDAAVSEVADLPPKRGRRGVTPAPVAAIVKSSTKIAAGPPDQAYSISSLKKADKSVSVGAEVNVAEEMADSKAVDEVDGGDVRIIFTGIEPEPAMVRRIGATVTERPEQATHMVIGDELKRTPKLMVAINAGVRHVVTLDWLAKSAAKGRPLPITKASRFTVRDPVKEKLWGFDLARTLAVPRGPDRRGVFHGLRVLVTPGVLGVKVPKEDEMAAIVTSGGGRFLPPSLAAPAPEEGEEGSGVIVVSSADVAPTLPAALVNAASRGPGRGVYSADFVFLATLRQEVRFDEDIILRSVEVEEDKVEDTGKKGRRRK